MKAITLIIFAGLLVAVNCRPDKSDLKQFKAEAARKKACLQDCTHIKIAPICASKQSDKPKSFANACIMDNYNCENKDSLHKVRDGECPDSDGIRIS